MSDYLTDKEKAGHVCPDCLHRGTTVGRLPSDSGAPEYAMLCPVRGCGFERSNPSREWLLIMWAGLVNDMKGRVDGVLQVDFDA